jgi:hypothetical protein
MAGLIFHPSGSILRSVLITFKIASAGIMTSIEKFVMRFTMETRAYVNPGDETGRYFLSPVARGDVVPPSECGGAVSISNGWFVQGHDKTQPGESYFHFFLNH